MILQIKDLNVNLKTPKGVLPVLSDINFEVNKGEILGIVGESGSGKSMLGKAILGLIPDNMVNSIGGQILYNGKDISKENESYRRRLRGRKIGIITQEPMAAFNPMMNMNDQMDEIGYILQTKLSTKQKISMLESVRINGPEEVLKKYPHQLSGGMLQRIMIAKVIALSPDILIADEPTTALDVQVQTSILNLLRSLAKDREIAMIIITHDVGVIKSLCSRVMVMYCGRIVEINSSLAYSEGEDRDTHISSDGNSYENNIFTHPLHPYTKGLLDSYRSLEVSSYEDDLLSIPGTVPQLNKLPRGCNFQDRCPYADQECKGKNGDPELKEINKKDRTACFHPFI